MNEWQNSEVVNEYAKKAATMESGWYEYEVNFPDLIRLIPKDTRSVLDFGCGPAEFTYELDKIYEHVEGVDMSPMIEIARQNQPNITFTEWNGLTTVPKALSSYDVIFSKLVVQFIEDLPALLDNFQKILNRNGVVVISVLNPERIAEKLNFDPETVTSYDYEVGNTGIKVHPIHRPQSVYEEIFTNAGFSLVAASQPVISEEVSQKYKLASEQASGRKRLNMIFKSNRSS